MSHPEKEIKDEWVSERVLKEEDLRDIEGTNCESEKQTWFSNGGVSD
jgi:hypothetical protein